jgi:hypothetical protein
VYRKGGASVPSLNLVKSYGLQALLVSESESNGKLFVNEWKLMSSLYEYVIRMYDLFGGKKVDI